MRISKISCKLCHKEYPHTEEYFYCNGVYLHKLCKVCYRKEKNLRIVKQKDKIDRIKLYRKNYKNYRMKTDQKNKKNVSVTLIYSLYGVRII